MNFALLCMLAAFIVGLTINAPLTIIVTLVFIGLSAAGVSA